MPRRERFAGAAGQSEREAWEEIQRVARYQYSYAMRALADLKMLNVVSANRALSEMEALARRAEAVADVMLAQLRRGIHENPALVVYGNPRGDAYTPGFHATRLSIGPKLGEVEQLSYERMATPRGYYFHDFGDGDALHVARTQQGSRVVVIANEGMKPLWGTEEEG